MPAANSGALTVVASSHLFIAAPSSPFFNSATDGKTTRNPRFFCARLQDTALVRCRFSSHRHSGLQRETYIHGGRLDARKRAEGTPCLQAPTSRDSRRSHDEAYDLHADTVTETELETGQRC
ncbi:hypothetical protein B0H16DRAFT_1879584 [Mycena metata]|uniref:Uncharacterized protein n=1 Tax=Mycena metata TaxID=1033252 RepID=A0AAD7K394_9AGAR|nr:hypothetical protein B0H16DRAFT_1879584 [Mycena metata]